MSFNYELMAQVKVQVKLAEVNPSDVILVSGHSGAGKTTAARRLSELMGIPLKSVDDYPDFREFFKSDPTNKHLELVRNSPERKAFKQVARDAVRDALSNLSGPAVIEGGQLSYMPVKFLQQYPNRVIVKTPLKTLLEQRLERVKNKQLAKGKPWDDEIANKRNEAAKAIYNSNVSSMNRFSKIPGTVSHGSREPIEKLVELFKLKSA
jgi:dephospho-CoA kinase